jgi:hypothetical protein
LFEAVRLAERYDLAIMSTKGMSSTASRELVDDLCGAGNGGARIPLLVLHDFDKAGFSILGTLQRDTRRYEFNSHPEVVDLGLRLADIQAHGLMPELVSYGKSDPTWNLGENGATPEEIRFLSSTHDHRGYSGQRVELNAFPSDQLIAWIEGKLQAHGMKKVIPDETTLRAAFRRAVHLAYLRAQLEALEEDAEEAAKTAKFPKTLRPRIRQRFERDPAVSWDRVVRELADAAVEDLDEEVGE